MATHGFLDRKQIEVRQDYNFVVALEYAIEQAKSEIVSRSRVCTKNKDWAYKCIFNLLSENLFAAKIPCGNDTPHAFRQAFTLD